MLQEKPKRFEMIDDAMVVVLRRMTDAEKLGIVFRLWDMVRDMVRANIRAENPEWEDQQVDRATARRMSHGRV